VYRGDAYGPEFVGNTFTGDAGGNLVHRKIIRPDGVSVLGQRPDDEAKREFLASRDTWFRPVHFANAPDGALYIADMYRLVIEHPEWIPKEMQARLDLRAGADKGRIYRVLPEGVTLRKVPNLGKMTGAELAAVYVPTTPNPTSGYLEIVPVDRLTPTDWSVDQAMTFVISGGAVSPDKIPFTKAQA
jgi:hypothetical protein